MESKEEMRAICWVSLCVTVCFVVFVTQVASCNIRQDEIALEARKYPVKIERSNTVTVDSRPLAQ